MGPKFVRPELLIHAMIPRPLFGFAPRTIMGEEWWYQERSKAYRGNGGYCWACGDLPEPGHPLEAHEMYTYQFEEGIATYNGTAGLCHRCHRFIHIGRTGTLYSRSYTRDIFNRGIDILRGAGLQKEWLELQARMAKAKFAPDDQWRLMIDGKEYKPHGSKDQA